DEDSKSFTIKIYNDDIIEGSEHFDIVIDDAEFNAHPNRFDMPNFDFERVEILDDDSTGSFQFSTAAQSVSEATPGFANVTVTRTGGIGGVVTVVYSLTDG